MITVTGATGQFGRLVIADLLARGVPAGDITAAVRSPEKAAGLGVRVVEADYDRPETLVPAFAGTDRLLFISGSEVGRRIRQHQNVVDAAREAGVGLIVYTSAPKATTSSLQLAAEHKATEEAIAASGLPSVILRNGWYFENYTGTLAQTLERGVIVGSAGDGRVSAASRADLAAAAAAVLVDPVPGSVYELGGDEAFTLSELAAEVSAQSGTPVSYRDLPVDEYTQVLVGAGLPQPVAAVFADSDRGLSVGDLFIDSGDLRRLIGRPPTSLADAVADALKP
ncbi:SDR family oxidoreductase [Cryptosporangium aurantiacum]|uniref:NAD(P)H dehydrogenase (Quinone) n=1 Tax=Cryptosporangium aurantiacum TaxID=134849 RepID=A0A1M7JLA9_9ACTN|nr:SDR family oxidoreductase [Cryptosporangium aurantiacum]SHM53746.1 NAD(P)H dehydrogenase (quinone) [Cryptosporangium aurantiacum]